MQQSNQMWFAKHVTAVKVNNPIKLKRAFVGDKDIILHHLGFKDTDYSNGIYDIMFLCDTNSIYITTK